MTGGNGSTKLNGFDFATDWKIDTTTMLLGLTNAGKTTLMTYIWSQIAHRFRRVILIQDVEKGDYPHIAPLYRFNLQDHGLDHITKMLAKLKQDQIDAVELWRRMGEVGEPPRIAIQIDDMGSYSKFKTDKTMRWMFSAGRHQYFTVFANYQYMCQLAKELRENCNYHIILQAMNEDLQKHLWKNYANFIPTFQHFAAIINRYTRKREALLMYTNPSNCIDETLFSCMVPPKLFKNGRLNVEVRVGSEKYYRVSERHYYNKRDAEFKRIVRKKKRKMERARRRKERAERRRNHQPDMCKVSTIGTDVLSSELSESSGIQDSSSEEEEEEERDVDSRARNYDYPYDTNRRSTREKRGGRDSASYDVDGDEYGDDYSETIATSETRTASLFHDGDDDDDSYKEYDEDDAYDNSYDTEPIRNKRYHDRGDERVRRGRRTDRGTDRRTNRRTERGTRGDRNKRHSERRTDHRSEFHTPTPKRDRTKRKSGYIDDRAKAYARFLMD